MCCVVLVLLAASVRLSTSAPPPVVITTLGPAVGETVAGADVFLGLPFAEAPVGNLRLHAPIPASAWGPAPKIFTSKPPECPQLHPTEGVLLGREDCLFMDVYVPTGTAAGANLPVMLWLHGGGFIMGNAEGGLIGGSFNGTSLAVNHNVIVIALQYRLGVLGFLALPDDMGSGDGVLGNLALQDQRLGMTFAKANARAFGGDPARITLFGQSAGAVSVCAHVTSAASAGLFSRAIAESPLCDSSIFFADAASQVSFGTRYSASLGCSSAGIARLTCLRLLPLNRIVSSLVMNRSAFPPLPGIPLPPLFPVLPWVLTVDNAPNGVVARPLDQIKAGRFNSVPFIIGTNKDEFSEFVLLAPILVKNVTIPLRDSDVALLLHHFFSAVNTTLILAVYPRSAFLSADEQAAAIMRDWWFTCPALAVAAALSSQAVQPPQPVFSYQFEFPLDSPVGKIFGDFHSAELPYVFDNPEKSWAARDHALAQTMGCLWASFAAAGAPNSSCLSFAWTPYSAAQNLSSLVFADSPAQRDNYMASQCEFWTQMGF